MFQFQIAHQNRTKTFISRAKPTLLPGKSMWPWVCFPGIRNSTKVVTPPLSRLHHYGSEISRCTRRQHQHRYPKATLTDETPHHGDVNALTMRERPSASVPAEAAAKSPAILCPVGLVQLLATRPSVLDPSAKMRRGKRGFSLSAS